MPTCTQAWAPVDARAQASATSIAVTLPTTTTGDTLVGAVTFDGSTDLVSTIVYSVGSTAMTELNFIADSVNGQSMVSFILKNITGGTTPTVTVNFSSSRAFRGVAVHGVSTADTTTQPDGGAGTGNKAKQWSTTPGTGTDANNAGTAITPTADGCYFFSATMDSSANTATHTAGTSYTRDTNGSSADVDIASESFIQTTAASLHGRWTENQSNLFLTCVVVVKSTATPGTGSDSPSVGMSESSTNLVFVSIVEETN